MRWSVVVAMLLTGLPTVASAHVALEQPLARYSRDYLKDGPCGRADNPPGESVATYAPGETITVRWDEFIDHPGHFRLALSAEGDSAFVDPVAYDDLYSAPNVLADGIEDPGGVQTHEYSLTLPDDLECEACVLQLIQVMTDKPPWGPEGGNELYYQCADIRISADAATGGEMHPSEMSGGCSVADPPAPTGAWLLLLGLVGRRRRLGSS